MAASCKWLQKPQSRLFIVYTTSLLISHHRCPLLQPQPRALTVRSPDKSNDLSAGTEVSLPPHAHMRAHHLVQSELRTHASTCHFIYAFHARCTCRHAVREGRPLLGLPAPSKTRFTLGTVFVTITVPRQTGRPISVHISSLQLHHSEALSC